MSNWTKDMQLRDGSSLIFHQIIPDDPTEFGIFLIVETGDDGVDGVCIHVDYQPSTVSRMHAINIAASFDHILSQITQDPSVPLNQVMGIRTRDLDQTSNWDRVLSLPEDKCLHDLLIEKVIEDPTREAGFHTDVGAASSIGITHIGQKPVVPPGTFSAECSIISEDNYVAVSVAVIWDDRAMGEDDAKRVMEMWKDIIVRG